MSTWDKRYTDRVQLLVDILPMLAREPRFALKGGTAINLFEHDLPRLSVDIDLAWLPVHDFDEDSTQIAGALETLADTLRARPMQLNVQTSASQGSGGVTRLVVSRGRARVQIETTPVMRGTVHPVREMTVRPNDSGRLPGGERRNSSVLATFSKRSLRVATFSNARHSRGWPPWKQCLGALAGEWLDSYADRVLRVT